MVGGTYAVKLLFEYCVFVRGVPNARRLCEEQLRLVTASSARGALREANRQGRAGQFRYRNGKGNPVHLRFVGVIGLLHIGAEMEPNEVWYSIGERLRPMERRRHLVPKPKDLNAIRDEKLLLGRLA
jgi:hypothetical protein